MTKLPTLSTDVEFRDDTLAKLLQEERVPYDTILKNYPDFSGVATNLIGLVPICDTYLDIWPKAFKSYNLIVPNLMNVPFAQMRVGAGYGRGSALQGLGMYMISKSAACPYCTAHTCSYAIRRGTQIPTLLAGMDKENEELRPDEEATIAVAQSLGQVPCKLTNEEKTTLVNLVGKQVCETVVFGMLSMGYLNKVMDSIGIELEIDTYLETKDLVGTDFADSKAGVMLDSNASGVAPPSKDSLGTLVRLIPHIPGALMLDAQYTKGVPNTWPKVGEHLQKTIGYNFPGLSSVSKSFLGKRVVTAIATTLIDNYSVDDTYCTVPVKVIAGLIFAEVAESDALKTDFEALAKTFNVSEDEMKLARQLAASPSTAAFPDSPAVKDKKTKAYLRLARAIAPSPAEVSADIVNEIEAAGVEPKGMVEMCNFIAVAQMLLRLDAFYPRSEAQESSESFHAISDPNIPSDFTPKETSQTSNRPRTRKSNLQPKSKVTSKKKWGELISWG